MENKVERVFYLYKFLYMTIMIEGIRTGYNLSRYFRDTDENENELLKYQGKTIDECLEMYGPKGDRFMNKFVEHFSKEEAIKTYFEHPDVYEYITKERVMPMINQLIIRSMMNGERIGSKKEESDDKSKVVS